MKRTMNYVFYLGCVLQILGAFFMWLESASNKAAPSDPNAPKSGEFRLVPVVGYENRVVVEQYRESPGWVPIAGKDYDRRIVESTLEEWRAMHKKADTTEPEAAKKPD